jgi:hypothetical protein
MNVEIGSETMKFPEKKYINGIFVADCRHRKGQTIFIFGHSVLFFRYFESQVPGRIPRRYSLPLPASFKLWVRRKWDVWRSSSDSTRAE